MTIGTELQDETLVLTRNRDFKWTFTNLDSAGAAVNYPSGQLFFELFTDPKTTWTFSISGAVASLKVESTAVDLIPPRTRWQLVWLPLGEAAGGDPLAIGTVVVQG